MTEARLAPVAVKSVALLAQSEWRVFLVELCRVLRERYGCEIHLYCVSKQEKIYYVIADSFLSAKNSPLLEVFRKKGIEVLLLHDKVDEWLVSHLAEFEGKKLQSVAKGALDLDEVDEAAKEEQKEQEKEFEDYVKQMKESLKDKVKDVRITNRLTDSPACVVFDDNDMSGHMQRLLAQAGQSFAANKPILELNPKHPLIVKIKALQESKELFSRWSDVMLSQALLAEGEQLKDPAGFIKDLNKLLLED